MKPSLVVSLIVLAIASVSITFGVYVHRGEQRLHDRVTRDGFDAGAAGIPVEACPYGLGGWNSEPRLARWWRTGWIEGNKSARHEDRPKSVP